jgi:hypothetical protein
MCKGCVDSGAVLWTRSDEPAARAGAASDAQPGGSIDIFDSDVLDDALCRAADEADGVSAIVAASDSPPPLAPLAPLPPPPPPPQTRYITHGGAVGGATHVGEAKGLLGKGLWELISPKLPRVQRDGSLELPQQPSRAASGTSSAALLQAFEDAFPHAPLYHPPRAEQRAQRLKTGVAWPREQREAVMACFACEAASITPIIFVPEVIGRRELEADARFRAPEGCMCICPSCEVNTYVKPDGINATQADRLRFAWGEGCCYVGIFAQYVCFNPACPDVIAKHEGHGDRLDQLKEAVGGGVFLRRGGTPQSPLTLSVVCAIPGPVSHISACFRCTVWW